MASAIDCDSFSATASGAADASNSDCVREFDDKCATWTNFHAINCDSFNATMSRVAVASNSDFVREFDDNCATRTNSHISDQPSRRKRFYPDRLKINIWKIADEDRIKDLRDLYGIDTSIIMRHRGVGHFKRIELWCQSRKSAIELLAHLKSTNSCKRRHFSIGTTFHERSKRKKNPIVSQEEQSLVIMHWNARSLRNKSDDLKKILEEEKVRVACIQESFLPQNDKYHPKFKGYNLYSLSRQSRGGGGLATIIHESLVVENNENIVTSKLELSKFKLRVSKTFAFTLCNVYIPGQGLRLEDLSVLVPTDAFSVIVGDFNSKHHSWNTGPENGNGKTLHDWLLSNGVVLLNKSGEATFQSASNGSLSTLDLSLVTPTAWNKVINWRIGQDLGSDHFPIFLHLDIGPFRFLDKSVVHCKFKIQKADWISFEKETKNSSSDDCTLNAIEQDILAAAAKCIPKSRHKNNRRHINNWWNEELDKLRKERTRARNRWKRFRSPQNRANYNKCSAILRKTIFESKRRSWNEFVSSMNSNTPSSTVWKNFKAINGQTSKKMQAIADSNGVMLFNDEDKVEAFAGFYSERSGSLISWPKCLLPEEKDLISRLDLLTSVHDPDDLPFTIEELCYCMSKIKCSAPGQDDIHNDMLKHCSPEMLKRILELFNRIWDSGSIPQNWKTAKIIPLPKPGKDALKIESYRPISLTSCLGKLLERLINTRLSFRLENGNLLDNLQFGFRRSRSTVDALLFITSKIYQGFDKKESTIAVFIDFEAAFDKIPHSTIILQAVKLGVRGKLLQFLINYLQDRHIQVSINGVLSNNHNVNNGIPQGSVISPTLFNIALQHLSSDLPSGVYCCSYADDVTLWVTSANVAQATKSLQAALDKVSCWCSKWSLNISQGKTECTFFTRRNSLVNHTPRLALNGVLLHKNENPKLLGVILDTKLRWAAHIRAVIGSFSTRLNALKAVAGRAWGADTSSLRQFYLCFIRSKLTYGCEVWGSAARTHINKLQHLQSAALRLCLGCPRTTPIKAMEAELGVEPIEIFIARQIWFKYLNLQSLPTESPLLSILNIKCKIKNSFQHRVNSLSESLPSLKPEMIPIYYSEPPWSWPVIRINLSLPNNLNKKTDPMFLNIAASEMISTHYSNHVKIFTDGSVDLENGLAGAGFFNQSTGEKFFVPASSNSSMDAELLAINAALVSCTCMTNVDKVCILTDSKSALQALSSNDTNSYSFRISELRQLILKIQKIGIGLCFQWVPSHCGITGNEIADIIAKCSSQLFPVQQKIFSLAHCKSSSGRAFRKHWATTWKTDTTGRNLFKVLPVPAEEDLFRNVPRIVATFAARARVGHLVTQAYLHRFHLAESAICALCEGDEEDIYHILLGCTYPIFHRDILRGEATTVESILKDKNLWTLACLAYQGHRAIGYN